MRPTPDHASADASVAATTSAEDDQKTPASSRNSARMKRATRANAVDEADAFDGRSRSAAAGTAG